MSAPAEMTLSEFARHIGKKGSWVTQLKKDGRLALTDDGKRVRVAESVAQIAATSDPSAQQVAERHAMERQAKAAPPTDAPDDPTGAEKIGTTYQAARAVKERYLAMGAKRDYEISIGKLLDAAAVHAEVADILVTLRGTIEVLPDVLSPQLAALPDEQACRALLADHIETALAECARRFAQIGGAAK